MEIRWLDVVVCPLCKSSLQFDQAAQELICNVDKLAFPIRDQIPVLLIDEARDTVAATKVTAPDNAAETP